MTDQCPHKHLKKQLTGRQFWYRCEDCPQKFNAEPWDGKVELVEPDAPVAVTGEQAAEPHDWECTAIGEKGYYVWRCKGCGMSVRYPSPDSQFPKNNCSLALRATKTAKEKP